MKWNVERTVTAGALALALSGCGMVDGRGDGKLVDRRPLPAAATQGVSDFPVKIGEPYKVGSITYKPEDRADYDDVGYASWYGDELQGKVTANGEPFSPDAITAAHRTLPLPSYVEVTSLDTGRTILVRVNDRGPFSNDRLIDLSQGAARQLGIAGQGHAPVRVRRVTPPEQERAALRLGNPAAERLESPTMMLTALRRKLGIAPTPPMAIAAAAALPAPAEPAPKPAQIAAAKPSAKPAAKPATKPAPKPVPAPAPDGDRFVVEGPDGASRPAASATPRPPVAATPAKGNWFVQLAAFSSKPRADALAKRAGAHVDAVGSLYRVRFGPYPSEAAANESLRSIKAKGYPEARILSGG
jgi:rare lipoprotein A